MVLPEYGSVVMVLVSLNQYMHCLGIKLYHDISKWYVISNLDIASKFEKIREFNYCIDYKCLVVLKIVLFLIKDL